MKCSLEGCNQPSKYAGLCGMHYKRKWRHGDANKTLVTRHHGEECSVEGCNNIASQVGMCTNCRQRFVRYGRTHNIVNRGSGYHINQAGYVVIYVNGKQKYEHIDLAERALGKSLPSGAVVHHTKAPWDNHGPFKLVVCPDQSYHRLLHDRAKELGYENN